MKIILSTSSTDPNFNGDCDHAGVDLTPESVAQIKRRVDLARQAGQQDNDLYELSFWGGEADFYDRRLADACQDAIAATDGDQAACDWLDGLEQDGHAPLPATVDLGAHEIQRTECDQVVVRCSPSSHNPQFEIVWTTIPKHMDVDVSTRELPLAAMDSYFQQAGAALA
jgi:hypothetical protein